MSGKLVKILMGSQSLDDFMDERGRAIVEIGKRSSGFTFKSVEKNGGVSVRLYSDSPKIDVSSEAFADKTFAMK